MSTCGNCDAQDVSPGLSSCPSCGHPMRPKRAATGGRGGLWVALYTASAALTSKVDDALGELAPKRPTFGRTGNPPRIFRVIKPTGPRDLPETAAFVVTTGSGKTAERFALTLGAMALVLPEAGEYLLKRARRSIEQREPLVLVGWDVRPGGKR